MPNFQNQRALLNLDITSLPLVDAAAPIPVAECHKVDALGMHVLLLGARERQLLLLEPIFNLTPTNAFTSRLEILSQGDRLGYLASIEPMERPATLLLQGRIVNPFSLVGPPASSDSTTVTEQLTFHMSFPAGDENFADLPSLLFRTIDDRLYETTEWKIEKHQHFDTPLLRHTFSFRPRATTLIFPLGAP